MIGTSVMKELNVSRSMSGFKAFLTPSDIVTSKYHKCTGFHDSIWNSLSPFHCFTCKLVDLMFFSFLQGKICGPKNRVRLRGSARPSSPNRYRARNLSRPVIPSQRSLSLVSSDHHLSNININQQSSKNRLNSRAKLAQQTFTCSKSTIETLEKSVKCIQS